MASRFLENMCIFGVVGVLSINKGTDNQRKESTAHHGPKSFQLFVSNKYIILFSRTIHYSMKLTDHHKQNSRPKEDTYSDPR